MYYDSNKGEEQEESQALFSPLMYRRERKRDGDEEEEEEAGEDEVFLNAHLGRRTFVLFIRSQRDGFSTEVGNVLDRLMTWMRRKSEIT